jgi:hypothetical protein
MEHVVRVLDDHWSGAKLLGDRMLESGTVKLVTVSKDMKHFTKTIPVRNVVLSL